MSDAHPQAEAMPRESDWRTPVLNASLWIAAGLGTIWLAVVLLVFPFVAASVEFVLGIASFVVAWTGALARGANEAFRAIMLLLFCIAMATIGMELVGPRPVVVVMSILFVLLATLYFGRGVGIAAGVFVMIEYAVAAIGWTTGFMPRNPMLADKNYTELGPWLTATMMQMIGIGSITAVVAYVLHHATRTLRQAQESEEKFHKAFSACPDPAIISELETGRIIELNESAEHLFGIPRARAKGRTALDLGMWGDQAARERFVRTVERGRSVRGYRGTGRGKDGTPFEFEAGIEVIELKGRKCLVTVVRDITEKLRQAELREQLQAQVRESQKLEALGNLSGGIAHDFNNLLMVISSNAELAHTDADQADEARARIEEIQVASGRARDLVRQILAFSRRQPNTRTRIQLRDVVVEALRLLRSTLPAMIEIETQMDRECPPVLGDPSQLHQIFMNLGTNAAHAMRDQSGTLSVNLDPIMVDDALTKRVPELKPGAYVRITFTDTGCGMPDPIREHVFEPFFTTKDPGEGTGLGLSVVHGIVRAHDGAITVESKEGHGARFTIYLPALTEDSALSETVEYTPGDGRGEKILVVDDEPAVCRALKATLERQGYEVKTLRDGHQAVQELQSDPHSCDLILTDLNLRQMTGVDLARTALSLRPELLVLIISGYTATWTREKVRALGIRDLLFKPISRSELAAAVREALDSRAASSCVLDDSSRTDTS